MEGAGVVGLFKDGGDGQLGGVGEQAGRARGVPHTQHGCRGERELERGKALLLRGAPAEGSAGAAKGREGGGEVGEALDKPAVVVGEADEATDVGARRGGGPVLDGRDLAGVNSDTVL